MDSNTPSEDTNVTINGVYQVEKKLSHCFSVPWEDSDVILVVENEKFHVHRLILSMNSPVFKAMFKSQFKESTVNEIPLPEKKASEVLDFLKYIYFQYIEERVEITMENIEHLLKLSDEYQVRLVFNPCVKFLEDQLKTKENVMKILRLAELYSLDNVRQSCNGLLKDMKLKSMSEIVHLQDLDYNKLQNLLTQRIKRLETFLDESYPQFMGLVACLFWLLHEADKDVKWCTEHVCEGKLKYTADVDDPEIRACSRCRQMLVSIVQESYYGNSHYRRHHYGGKLADCYRGFLQVKTKLNSTILEEDQSMESKWKSSRPFFLPEARDAYNNADYITDHRKYPITEVISTMLKT